MTGLVGRRSLIVNDLQLLMTLAMFDIYSWRT
jgi:hypothetical protein